jgi:FKBP-type peptidyl-prolyl cis-trans isomerase
MKTNSIKWLGLVTLLALMSTILMLSGCLKTVEPTSPEDNLKQQLANVNKAQLEIDFKIIDDSLAKWGLTPVILKETNGVRYEMKTMGSGVKPSLSNKIRIKYSGRLLSTGKIFDSSASTDFYLYQLVIGFQTTMPLIPKGSIVTLYIPSGYGYGPTDLIDNSGNVLIPKNANLIFDVELLDIL